MRKRWAGLVAVILILLCSGWYFLFGGIRDQITVEAGTSIGLSDFSEHGGFFLEAVSNLDEIDLTVPGAYPVTLRCLWREIECNAIVEDTIPPAGQVHDMTAIYTQMPTPEDFLVSSDDATAVTVSFAQPPDGAGEGMQTVAIRLTDLGANVTELEAKLTLIFDHTAPVISGAEDQRVYLGTKLELLEGITITDDLDANAILSMDDSAVNWEAAGSYPVTYHAVDACGNESEATITVTVIEDVTP